MQPHFTITVLKGCIGGCPTALAEHLTEAAEGRRRQLFWPTVPVAVLSPPRRQELEAASCMAPTLRKQRVRNACVQLTLSCVQPKIASHGKAPSTVGMPSCLIRSNVDTPLQVCPEACLLVILDPIVLK